MLSFDGPGLYQDDTGHDVRTEFRELIGDGLSAEEATQRMVAGWTDVLADEEVYCAFYLTMADTQWRLGRPVPSVLEVALSLIDSGRDLRRWEYSTKFHGRRRGILQQLRVRLTSKPPPPRPVRNPAVFISDLQAGDVIRYTSESGIDYWIGIVGNATMNGNRWAIARLLDWDGHSAAGQPPPNVNVAPEVGAFALMPYRGVEVPSKRSVRLTGAWNVTSKDRQDTVIGCSLLSWGSNLDVQLHRLAPTK